MRRRLRLYRDNTSWDERLKLLVLAGFPAWVSHFPLFHYTFGPWIVGLVLPGLLVGFFRDRPRTQLFVVVAMLASCLIGLYLMENHRYSGLVWWLCGWLWFCLAFSAGLQFWMISDPVAEERRQLLGGFAKLNQQMDETLAKLKEFASEHPPT